MKSFKALDFKWKWAFITRSRCKNENAFFFFESRFLSLARALRASVAPLNCLVFHTLLISMHFIVRRPKTPSIGNLDMNSHFALVRHHALFAFSFFSLCLSLFLYFRSLKMHSALSWKIILLYIRHFCVHRKWHRATILMANGLRNFIMTIKRFTLSF